MDSSSVLLQQLPSYPSDTIDFSSSADIPALSRQYDLMAQLERLKEFLATAPTCWSSSDAIPISQQHPALKRFLLPSNEYVTCVDWGSIHYITGTDIVRALVFRFEAFGRPVRSMKKFEEGIFSDLRNLKPGQDACLEDPKSPFLDLLFKYQCIRTQKKQKVFFWFSVPHDRLFIDALERDLKREKIGLESTTSVVAEPALSFAYDPKRPLFEQINASTLSVPTPYQLRSIDTCAPRAPTLRGRAGSISLPDLKIGASAVCKPLLGNERFNCKDGSDSLINPASQSGSPMGASNPPADVTSRGNSFFNIFSFLEGTPTYKQRRKKVRTRRSGCINISHEDDRVGCSLGLHSARRSFDIAPRNLVSVADSGRHSLDSLQGSFTFLNGSAHHEFPFHLGAERFRVPGACPVPQQDVSAPASSGIVQHTPTPEYICPLYTCRQAFAYPGELHQHMSQHAERSGGSSAGDPKGQVLDYTAPAPPTAHPVSVPRNVNGSPEIPALPHVLTTPNGSPRYEYEYDNENGYALHWSQHLHTTAKIEDQEHANTVCEQSLMPPPASSSPPGVAPQPRCPQHRPHRQWHAYTFDSRTFASISSSPCHPPPSPSSAPADELRFDLLDVLPINGDNVPVRSRRPRSVTPPNSQPGATYHRRPSTATAVLTPFSGGSVDACAADEGPTSRPTSSFNVARSNSFTTVTLLAAQQLTLPPWRAPLRGYHPYAAPEYGLNTRPSTSFSTSPAPSSQGSGSPFAYVSPPENEYDRCQSSAGGYEDYLQEEHDDKYELQEYRTVHEAEPEYGTPHAEYVPKMAYSAVVASTNVVATVNQVLRHRHHPESIEDGGNGGYEHMSKKTHQYLSQTFSPKVQFVGTAVPTSLEHGTDQTSHDVSSGNYATQVENAYAISARYERIPEVTVCPEFAASYFSGHKQPLYLMQASTHNYYDHHNHQHHYFLHNPHYDEQVLPHYQQQIV